MKTISIITMALLSMFSCGSHAKGQASKAEFTAPTAVADSSSGVVVFFFPNDLPNGLEWNHLDGTPAMDGIALYNPGDSIPFDTLRFELKHYKIVDPEAIFDGECYSVESTAGATLAPFRFVQGEQSAHKARRNIVYSTSTNSWELSHLFPESIYDVAFRLIGEWGEWLYIMIDDSTKQCAYIRSDSARMQLVPWECYMQKRLLRTPECDVLDEPNGKLIERNSTGGYIESRDGDWVKIYNSGWIKWKDKDGMLSGIYAFDPIE